jgi:hypothetical protein
MGPFLGLFKGPIFGTGRSPPNAIKVSIFWNWLDFLAARPGKQPLLINLDETSVSYAFSPYGKGHMVRDKAGKWPSAAGSKKQFRGSVTHVAAICDIPGVQTFLPQVFIGNHHRFTLKLMRQFEGRNSKPRNVHLWREKSSWNSGALLIKYLILLSASLLMLPTLQPILVLDVAPCHTTFAVIGKAAELGIWLAFVPAKLTCLLQPLDTHIFALYKRFLSKAYQDERPRHPTGVVTLEAWVQCFSASWICCARNLGDKHLCRPVSLETAAP